jgi:putative tryptophan/tyrosine transport system permease protein
MDLSTIMGLLQNAGELGLFSALTVLALFLSYTMLNVCDLSTDGCYTLGAVTGAVVAMAGHPFLSIPAAMAAGMISGFVTAFLQTKMGINSLLAGIIVNTGLYSVNIALMGNTALLNMNKTQTVFTALKDMLEGTPLAGQHKLIVALIAVAGVIVFETLFLRTRLGLSLRATGDNPDMLRASSINPATMTVIGLCVANAFTALSGCLLAQSQKSVNIDIGSGMVTVALASLLIGNAFMGRGSITKRAVGAALGAIIFRIVYMLALRFKMPAFMLKFVSSVIVIIAISGPYLKEQIPMMKRRAGRRQHAGSSTGAVNAGKER